MQGPGTDEAEVAKIREALAADPPRATTVTLLNYKKDGTPFWNALHVSPVRDADGRLEYFIGVQLDVTADGSSGGGGGGGKDAATAAAAAAAGGRDDTQDAAAAAAAAGACADEVPARELFSSQQVSALCVVACSLPSAPRRVPLAAQHPRWTPTHPTRRRQHHHQHAPPQRPASCGCATRWRT
jgi:hypothetical protein